MPLAEDPHPVGDIGPGREHEPFRIGIQGVVAMIVFRGLSGVVPQLMASLAPVRQRRGLRDVPCCWDVCAMDERADIVVAGAGHNSLIAACYLAKAGYRCLVLDARHMPGGGATTEEILLPGYGIDICATGHTLIRVNPLLTRDELGLIADYGLRYIDPDPVAHVAFPDGEQLTMWLDRDRTAAEIARFSPADAAAYLRLLDDYDEVKSVFSGSQFTPVGFGPSLDARLAAHPRGRLWQRRRALSAWDVIRHEFGSRHVQAFMLWMAFQTNQAVDLPGSGVLAYSLVFGRQQRSWSIPAGGSGRLTEALTGYLHSHGGTVLCGQRVTRLLLEGDRCAGVETADGGQYRAGKAVLSTIHVTQLRDMAPARAWPEEFHYGIDTYDAGIPGFGVYLATSAPPEFAAPDGGTRTAVSAGTAGWPEDVIRLGQDLRAGRFIADVPWLLVATPTLADPARAPSGKHTVKLLSQQVYQLPAGMPGWDVVKARHARRQLEHLRLSAPGFTDDVILAQLVKSPADYEQLNPHMVHGAFHGGDRGVAQTGPLRPVPGWASHRMPIAGLYQTGATTHPGGSITGAPGRNAAIVLLHDLGHDPAEVMSTLPTPEVRGGHMQPGRPTGPPAGCCPDRITALGRTGWSRPACSRHGARQSGSRITVRDKSCGKTSSLMSSAASAPHGCPGRSPRL
jgi:phytoene dehydrogenase-like protein